MVLGRVKELGFGEDDAKPLLYYREDDAKPLLYYRGRYDTSADETA